MPNSEYQKFVADFNAHVKTFGEKYGLHIKVTGSGSIMLGGKSLVFKVESATISADGAVNTKEKGDFLAMCDMYGFKKEDLGRKFIGKDRRTCEIVGLARKRSKYPIVCKFVDDGSLIFYPADSLKRILLTQSV